MNDKDPYDVRFHAFFVSPFRETTVTIFLNTNPALKLVKKCFYRNVEQLKQCQQTLENSTWIISFCEFVSGTVVPPSLQQKLDAEGEIQIKNWQTNLSAPTPMSFLDTLPWKKKEDGTCSVSLWDDRLPWKLAQDKATARNAVNDVKVLCPCEDTYQSQQRQEASWEKTEAEKKEPEDIPTQLFRSGVSAEDIVKRLVVDHWKYKVVLARKREAEEGFYNPTYIPSPTKAARLVEYDDLMLITHTMVVQNKKDKQKM